MLFYHVGTMVGAASQRRIAAETHPDSVLKSGQVGASRSLQCRRPRFVAFLDHSLITDNHMVLQHFTDNRFALIIGVPMPIQALTQNIELWSIERLIGYARNPRKNDSVADRMCASIREFGFKIPILARSDGEVVDGHLRLKAARTLGIAEIPVMLCDEWTPAQVKAFLLMVNRAVTWANWDEELLALELREIQESDFDLSLTGFDPGEIDKLLVLEDEEKANATPPLPDRRFRGQAICGYWDLIGYCAGTRRVPKSLVDCSAIASRGSS